MLLYRPFGSQHDVLTRCRLTLSGILIQPRESRNLKMTSRNIVGRILRNIFLVPTLIIVFSLGSFITASSQQTSTTTQTAQAAQPSEQMAPMRDGVKLSTIIYLPEGKGPWPVVLVRTPYGKVSQTRLHTTWTKAGFAFVAQDCRGTFQ